MALLQIRDRGLDSRSSRGAMTDELIEARSDDVKECSAWPVSDDDLAHLLRRTEFVVRPDRLADLKTLPIARRRRRRHPQHRPQRQPARCRRTSRARTPNGWDQYVVGVQVLDQRDGHQAAAVPGEDDAVLARPLRQRMVGRRQGLPHDAAERRLYRDNALGNFRTLTQSDGDRPGDARLPLQRREREGRAEPELRPRADGAVHARRRQLHRGRRRGVGRGVDRATTPTGPTYVYQFYPNRHDNGDKTFFGTTKNWNGPDIITRSCVNNADEEAIAARFITKKLWEFLAHPSPPAAVLDALAPVFAADMDLDATCVRADPQPPGVLHARRPSRAWCAHRSS